MDFVFLDKWVELHSSGHLPLVELQKSEMKTFLVPGLVLDTPKTFSDTHGSVLTSYQTSFFTYENKSPEKLLGQGDFIYKKAA